MYTTEAWVLYQGEGANPGPGELKKELFTFSEISPQEVLVEPIYGCWEGNMSHSIQRNPVDICKQREEQKVVIGNSGVVQVLKTGSAVTTVKEGDFAIVFGNAVSDEYGYMVKALAYDAPNTMGVLAKRAKMHQQCLIPILKDSAYSLAEWAAFSLRYCTAWANWHVSLNCWRSQMFKADPADMHVWAWGGGVALAELDLAKRAGFNTAMIASTDKRLQLIETFGIQAIDRRQFLDLRSRKSGAEDVFLDFVKEHTKGQGVAIFIDNIGTPVFQSTLKSLARQGVVTTSGWKHGMKLTILRAVEAINRHIHVHTHFANYSEGLEAVQKAEEIGWMAPVANDNIYKWDEIPQLAEAYEAGQIESYFPLFEVNAL